MNASTSSLGRTLLVLGPVLVLIALGMMRLSMPSGVSRESLQIGGPADRPMLGSLYTPATPPKAVMLVGHGVSCNQGVTATVAKAFAAEGYATVAFDFFGHGRSRENSDWRSNLAQVFDAEGYATVAFDFSDHFDWQGNPAQVLDWCRWARAEYPGLPLGYLGHSMGGFAAGEAFSDEPLVDAFIAMGAIPRSFPEVKTLVAAGQFEELFTPEEARERCEGKAEVLISPWSNHVGETWDPVLIRDMVAWMDSTLGFTPTHGFPWGRFALVLLGTAVGCAGALITAAAFTRLLRGESHPGKTPGPKPSSTRTWSVNPYRVAARALGLRGYGQPPTTSSSGRALLLGLFFAFVFIVPLSMVLTEDMFTSRLDHPERLRGWAIAALVLLLPGLLDVTALERAGIQTWRQRFLVGALTRAVPLLVVSGGLWVFVPNMRFGAMLLGILAFLLIMRSLVHAVVTRSAGDYRAGIVTSAVILGWIFMFWFPLTW